jgi:carboxylate-amine ligase
MAEVETPTLMEELLDFVDEVVDELGLRDELDYIRTIVARGPGADRQLAVWQETRDLKKVMDFILDETEHGLSVGPEG